MTPENKQWIQDNTTLLIGCFFVFSHPVDAGATLAEGQRVQGRGACWEPLPLALAFAGNDLVNFIGVPLGRLLLVHRLHHQRRRRRSRRLPHELVCWVQPKRPGISLSVRESSWSTRLCTSKKAHNVIKTSVDLSRQDEGEESFGSTPIARTLVRFSMTMANGLSHNTMRRKQQTLDRNPLPEGRSHHCRRRSVRLGTRLRQPCTRRLC